MQQELGNESEAFFQALATAPPVSIRYNPAKNQHTIPDTERVPWCENGCYLKERPVFTLDPFFHGGAYYVQEASSMFLEHVLKQIMPKRALRVLDLCAAPGGKSTLTASVLPTGSLLVANEIIHNRAVILKENIIKWGHNNILVSQNDPADFSALEGAFDIIIVDAPCSGEGMFRKDPAAIAEWSEQNLLICSNRQKKILSDIWHTLKPGGHLIYSTCTYNRGENEEIANWITTHFEAENIEIKHTYPAITPSETPLHAYRFYPHKTTGEGFFISVFQKGEGEEADFKKGKKTDKPVVLSGDRNILDMLPGKENYTAYREKDKYGIFPEQHRDFIAFVEKQLRLLYKGCEIAESNGPKFRPLHAFALYANIRPQSEQSYEVDLPTALKFLKKEEIPTFGKPGQWILIRYQGIGLGWCKNVGNRLNNYFPKEWRIRMNINEIQ